MEVDLPKHHKYIPTYAGKLVEIIIKRKIDYRLDISLLPTHKTEIVIVN